MQSQWTGPGQFKGTLLDLDYVEDSEEFERPITISLEHKERLLAQILGDVGFLVEHHVVDYSLFVGRAEWRYLAHVSHGNFMICTGCCSEERTSFGYHALHCLPSTTSPDECFYFSFLDITQKWNHKKAAERFIKVNLFQRDSYLVSSAPPGYYGQRFVERMNIYIKPVLGEDHPLMQRAAATYASWDLHDQEHRLKWCCL